MTTEEMINDLVTRSHQAFKTLHSFNQEQVDKITHAMAKAGFDNSERLAKMAVKETGRGVAHDKMVKNQFATRDVWNYIKDHKTVGIVKRDQANHIIQMAEPLGTLAGITPVTNPTSTVMFKAILAIKTRNPIIFSFHPESMKSSTEAGKVVREAAVKAGAPKDCIQWITQPNIKATDELMNHPGVAEVLATGGPNMVKAAYSTGKPALGVGPGNVPLYINKTADLDQAVNDFMKSKTFDNGMICATESSLIIDKSIFSKVKAKLVKHGVYFVHKNDQMRLAKVMFNPKTKTVNGPIAGKTAIQIAEMAEIDVPVGTKVLAVEPKGIGADYVLSGEKLSPVISIYKSNDAKEAFKLANQVLHYGGMGHTSAIQTKSRKLAIEFGLKMKTCRVLVNTPCALGGVGGIFNNMAPSLTLGTGSWGANSIDHNVTDYDLLNYRYLAFNTANL